MSSLFAGRTWWSYQPDGLAISGRPDDAFDRGCLVCAPIPRQVATGPPGTEDSLIIVGGFSGKLRLFRPHAGGYAASHLALETQLDQAIIQIAAGCFTESGPHQQIAILHPRKVVVYFVEVGTDAEEDQGNETKLVKLHEHMLERTSANFVHGKFGGREGKYDSICVQSMDGSLLFLDQDQKGFERFVPGFLIPGPLCYMPGPDSFVTCSSDCQIQAYRYFVLSAATLKGKTEGDDDTAGDDDTGKRVQVDWSRNIGEHALEIIHCPADPKALVVLGERSVFWIQENGVVTSTKRFECEISTCIPYRFGPNQIDMLVATHDDTLHVLKNDKIMWATHVDCVPVAVRVAAFDLNMGMIVCLADTGQLNVYYLGTDPAMPDIHTTAARDLDYGAMDAEMQELQGVIRNSVLDTPGGPIAGIVAVTHGKPEVKREDPRDPDTLYASVALHIRYAGTPVIKGLDVAIEVQAPLKVDTPAFMIESIGGDDSLRTLELKFTTEGDFPPNSVSALVSVSSVVNSEPRTTLHEITFPARFFCEAAPSTKSAQFKVTISTTHSAVDLQTLFRQGNFNLPGNVTPTSAGFKLCNGDMVSVLAAKSSARYRVMSDHFDAIWLITKLLIQMLKLHHSSGKTQVADFEVSYDDQLPLSEYFRLIDEHFEHRIYMEARREELASRAHQFRVIEKRLLIRFKDKTPQPLQHLDTLLESTHQDVLFVAEQLKQAKVELAAMTGRLSAGTQLLLLLMRLKFKLDDADSEVLENVFNPRHREQHAQGWEESVDSSLLFLLKTSLAKEPKDMALMGSALELAQDTAKLKKHITQVTERLLKGITGLSGPGGLDNAVGGGSVGQQHDPK